MIKKKVIIITVVVVVALLALILGLYFGLQSKQKGAVVANGLECAEIGGNILNRGGSVADAAIATLFCEGVTCPQSMGLGGGFILTIYTKSTGKAESLVARETAPKAATENMFVNVSTVNGPKAIAVPGELKGYWELHQRYGKLPWKELVQPTIDLCRKGHKVTRYLDNILQRTRERILVTPAMREIYINPATGDVWREGDYIKRTKLGETLEIVAAEGVNSIYKNGTIAQRLIGELKEMGAILTIEDLMEYNVRWQTPETAHIFEQQTLYTTPLPASGVLVTFMLNILNGYLPDKSAVSYHKIVEAMKYAYAKRSDLGDEVFVPHVRNLVNDLMSPEYGKSIREKINNSKTFNDYKHYGANFTLVEDDHGTAHINILAPNGDAISATSTINNIFGSFIRSQTTGIIMNDEMDDFSTPGKVNSYGVPSSPSNYIAPKKMPLSSMSPIIIVNRNGDVEMIIGGSGGIKITSSVAYTLFRYYYFNESLEDAVQARRVHHQLLPMHIQYEKDFDPTILHELFVKGHQMKESLPDSGFAAQTAIAVKNRQISAVVDNRRSGSIYVI